jgi:hypothetical protein
MRPSTRPRCRDLTARWLCRCHLPPRRARLRSGPTKVRPGDWCSISSSGASTSRGGPGGPLPSSWGLASIPSIATSGWRRDRSASAVRTAAAVSSRPITHLCPNAGPRGTGTPCDSSGSSDSVGMPGALRPWPVMRRVCAGRRARPGHTDRRGRHCRWWRRLRPASAPPVGRPAGAAATRAAGRGRGHPTHPAARATSGGGCRPRLSPGLRAARARARPTSWTRGGPGRQRVPSCPCSGRRRDSATTLMRSKPGSPGPGVPAAWRAGCIACKGASARCVAGPHSMCSSSAFS